MSQTLEQMGTSVAFGNASVVPAARPSPVEPGFDEFSYKPIPPLAPVSVLLAVCSLSGFLSPLGLIFAVFGSMLGWICLRQIDSADGGLGGGKLAFTGTITSAALLVSGAAAHVYWYQTELPEGFHRVSFAQDIAKKGFVIEDNLPNVHPDIRTFDGEKLFVKGYMYPESQIDGLSTFILCKDNGQCCFGGQPKLTDMIKVKMSPGLAARYTDGMVAVAGVFRLRDLRRAGNMEPAFELEATHFGPAKTWY